LIENGVKAVVVAGWAVDDSAAYKFAEEFYQAMFEGSNFGEAVLKARTFIFDDYPDTNTWGAYQCYGDPFYILLDRRINGKVGEREYVIEQEAEIELNNLSNDLETGLNTHDEFITKLEAISKGVDRAGLRSASITQAEAFIYAELGDYDLAIQKFESLLKMEKASFSVATLEKYCNTRAKKYVNEFLKEETNQRSLMPKMNKVIRDLKNLFLLSPTAERYSLLGSAMKQKAMLAPTKTQKIAAYSEAALNYRNAYLIQNDAYALTNWYTIECLLILAGKRNWEKTVRSGSESYTLPSLQKAIQELNSQRDALHIATNQNYWNMAALANIKLCLLLLHFSDTKNKNAWDEVLMAYRQLWVKAGSRGKKLAEIEHLETLADALSLPTKPGIAAIRKNIEQLKEELEKMI